MRTIVYGNGKSRQKWNVNEKLDNVVTWGCNRIFNDVKVDNLVAVDYHVQHLIYESGYAHENNVGSQIGIFYLVMFHIWI